MKKVCCLFTIALLAVSLLYASSLLAANPKKLGIYSEVRPKGHYSISLFEKGKWQLKSNIKLDQFYRSRIVEIGKTDGKTAKIMIKRVGGGAGHVDVLLLNDQAPIQTSDESPILTVKKLSKKDFDVAEITEKGLIITYPVTEKNLKLSLNGRIEGKEISKSAFVFPPLNKSMNHELKHFYSYALNSAKFKADIDGDLKEYFGIQPVFNEFSSSVSGHPSGQTYGWLSNDDQYLYAAIDFTPDNTMDGTKDYATVMIETPSGIKEFKVTIAQTKWGKPGFNYTEKVPYQHKVYEFKIPLSELGLTNLEEKQDIKVAFMSYGTASTGNAAPVLAFDSVNNRYLLAYVDFDATSKIYGQILESDGDPVSGSFPFPISDSLSSSDGTTIDIAFDPGSEKFLVVWEDSSTDVKGHFVDSNGAATATSGSEIDMGSGTAEGDIKVTNNSTAGNFLAVWRDNGEIYGRIISPTSAGSDFPVFDDSGTDTQSNPVAAYNSISNRFLVLFQSNPSNEDIHAILVSAAGAAVGSAVTVANDADDKFFPALAFDSSSEKFLSVFADGSTSLIKQLLTADGGLDSTSDTLASAPYISTERTVSIAYNSGLHTYLSIWAADNGGNDDIYASYINPSGSITGTNPALNNTSDNAREPSVAANNLCSNFLAAWHFIDTGEHDIEVQEIGDCQPNISVSDSSHDFGDTEVASSSYKTITITNLGVENLTISGISTTGTKASQFTQTNTCTSLIPNATCTVSLTFTPTEEGNLSALLVITSDDPDQPTLNISLSGKGVAATIPPEEEEETTDGGGCGALKSPDSNRIPLFLLVGLALTLGGLIIRRKL